MSAPVTALERSPGLRVLLATDPLAVFNLTDRLSSGLGSAIQGMALSAYAERDPAAAVALVDRMPRSRKRDEALASVAMGYALVDPGAALIWAAELSPPSTIIMSNVLRSAARHDIGQALEFALQATVGSQTLADNVMTIAAEDPAHAALAADRLLVADVERRDDMLSRLFSLWAARDSQSLLDWVNANSLRIDASALANAAFTISSRDAGAAARYTDRVPVELREVWIARVAQGYAASDPAGALDWIARYEGQPGYDAGMRFVINSYSVSDPVAAARVFATAAVDVQIGAARMVADQWARRDPEAAAEWARGQSDARVRVAAIAEAVGAWMSQSAQAAEDWTLRLPQGDTRDEALHALLSGRTRSPAPRETYSTHPAAALIARISDRALRREVEAWFAAADARGR
jgi:hypothetical protein